MSDLFGTSGIRGIVGEDITPELAIGLSRALASEMEGTGRVVVARDTRPSGEMIEDALVSGLLSSGFDVRKIGVVPTPVLGFSVPNLDADAGLMITASHNPPEYNGIKLFDYRGMPFSPDREDEIERIYQDGEFEGSDWEEMGEVGYSEVLGEYMEEMICGISLRNKYKVSVDCACGPSSRTTPSIMRELGCRVSTINSQLDGTFPGRSPEPVEENLHDLKEFVRVSDSDLGFAHDGDGDRITVVDEKGRLVPQDKLLALMGSYSVERFGGGVVTTVDASKIVEEEVSKVGGEVLRTKVGDVSVAQEMYSENFDFGGEPSGTWIFGDVHMSPDGTLAAAKILEMLDDQGEKLSELIDSMPSYPIRRDKVRCPRDEKSGRMKSVEDRALSTFDGVENVIVEDGLRFEFERGDWVLIRPSGTEPYIRITAEADEMDRVESLVKTAKDLLKEG